MAKEVDDEMPSTLASDDTVELRKARPPIDRVQLDAQRARIERALFRTAEPARLGRFVLLDTLAAGGMGVVHRAYDPELDRKVALKLLHPRIHGDTAARERLIAEARALARLRHPNVVAVHDVVIVDEQVVIVMELVEGVTLAEWEGRQPHGWRAIVAAFVAAGRGLAAAHALGLVHRDFKPANVIVGDDGRVRVLDFGLARPVGDDGEDAAAPTDVDEGRAPTVPSRRRPALTATGDVIGTLAYMAPEQLAAAPATAASDQFAFCVALYHALFGVSPFTGGDVASRRAAIESGRIAPPAADRHVPGWLRTLVVRGLAAAPAARHPSIDALLDTLERRSQRRRRLVVVPAALMVAGVALAVAFLRHAPPVAPLLACDADAEVESVWNPDRQRQVRDAIAAVGTPYATAVIGDVVDGLDAYRDAWVTARRAACLDERTGALAASLASRRTLCLLRAKGELAAGVDVLSRIDAATITRARDVVAGLRPLVWCADPVVLAAAADPAPAAIASEIGYLHRLLELARQEERTGATSRTLAIAVAVRTRAATLGYPPVEIEAALMQGRAYLFRREFAAAVEPLTHAELLALQHHLFADAVVASARRLYVQAMMGVGLTVLEEQAVRADALSRGLQGDDFARPLLLNNLGAIYIQRGDRAATVRTLEAARAALAGVPKPDLELAIIDSNLAAFTADPVKRRALVEGVWRGMRDRRGPEHPTTIDVLHVMSHFVEPVDEALRLNDEACALYARFHPDLTFQRAMCTLDGAFLSWVQGDTVTAAARYREVVVLASGSTDADAVLVAERAAGHVALDRDPGEALRHFTAVIDGNRGDSFGDRIGAAGGHLGAGLAASRLRRWTLAKVHLEIAECNFAEAAARNENVDNRRQLARSRAALAAVRRRAPAP